MQPGMKQVIISPEPCPRPRVTGRGITYYPKKYTAYKANLEAMLTEMVKCQDIVPVDRFFMLIVDFHLAKPKTTKYEYPTRCDLDNLVKGFCDAANGILFSDDRYMQTVQASKVWCCDRYTEPCIAFAVIGFGECEGQELPW